MDIRWEKPIELTQACPRPMTAMPGLKWAICTPILFPAAFGAYLLFVAKADLNIPLAIGIAWLALVSGLIEYRRISRSSFLLKYGLPVRGVITSSIRGPLSGSSYIYEYETKENLGKTGGFKAGELPGFLGIGQEVTVLYDPSEPGRSILYPNKLFAIISQ